MNFILPIVGLTLFLHDSSQTGLVTLQLDGIQTLFNSVRREKLDMSLNFEKYTDNLCSLVEKSKIFKLQMKPAFVYQKSFEPNSRAHSTIQTTYRTQKMKYNNPRPIENILELMDDNKNFSNSNYVSINTNDNLPAAVCNLFDKTSFYISNGIKIDKITFQFLIGKSVKSIYYPEPLALVGKPKLKFLEKNFDLKKLYSKLKNSKDKNINMLSENWTHSLTELQCIWIGVTIANYETKKGSKNFFLDFSYMLKNLEPFTIKDNDSLISIHPPLIRFSFTDMDNYEEKSIIVVPDYFGKESTYFYGIENNRRFTSWHYVQITF